MAGSEVEMSADDLENKQIPIIELADTFDMEYSEDEATASMESVDDAQHQIIHTGEMNEQPIGTDETVEQTKEDSIKLDVEEVEMMDNETKAPSRSIIVAGVESIRYLISKRRIRINTDSTVNMIKCLVSLGLLVFSVVIIMAAIFTKQTEMAKNVHPVFAFAFFWFLIAWLGMMEGGQGCLVGLQPVDKTLYAETHPVTLKNTALVHRGDNMERFIVGRQFLVVLVIFLINMCGASIKDAEVLYLPNILTEIFLASGVAMMLTTIIVGQLTAQVNAAVCMLDFINSYFMLFTCHVSLFIEFSGLLHSVYLMQIIFARITGNIVGSNQPIRSRVQNFFFWGRILVSLAVLAFALAVTLTALFDGNTMMWSGVPSAVSVIIFFLLLSFAGVMDGMQIAAFALVNLPEEELRLHPFAHTNCTLMFSGRNLQAFLIGRQICVACCMFVVARISTLDSDYYDNNENIFGVSDGLQNFLNTGLLGAVVLTVIGSLIWRIIASSFPIAFMSNIVVYFIIYLCLILEKSGVCSSAWLLARWHKHMMNYQTDEVYIGTADERTAAGVKADVTKDGKEINVEDLEIGSTLSGDS